MPALLQVENLSVKYRAGSEVVQALDSASLHVNQGEVLGVLGESGSGKSTAGLAILGILPTNATVTSGSIKFQGGELLGRSESDLQRVRGCGISIIFQEPDLALNPVMQVGKQVEEVLRAHPAAARGNLRDTVEETLDEVGLYGVPQIYSAYPHQLSGGQRQRVVIAQALVCRPSLVIADEPTASLDSVTQAEIMALLAGLKQKLRIAFLFITHDPSLLIRFADRAAVMYAGSVIEIGPCRDVLQNPLHPYTTGLMQSAQTRFQANGMKRYVAVPGEIPVTWNTITGCRFEGRCFARMEVCGTRQPGPVESRPDGTVRCFQYGG